MKQMESDETWEQKTIRDALQAYVTEQRRSRRWKVFFRLLLAGYLAIVFAMIVAGNRFGSHEYEHDHIGLVDINGPIEAGDQSPSSADNLIKGLRRAFDADNAKSVVLRINSPGGSPVQSAQVYREIMRLKALHPDKPIYAVAGDMAASGAYYIASAADYIYADPHSLIGSVGVIMSSFGFTDVMDRVGVDRRVYTAGNQKAFMDPFIKENPDNIAHIRTLLNDIHDEFISDVKAGRGDRLNASDEELFNGLIWTGRQAVDLGLVDRLGNAYELAEEEFGLERAVNYTQRMSPLDRLASRVSATFAETLADTFAGGWHIR